jgi:3-oxoacyl-[acyl-carrier-protein] synthase-3
MADSSELIMKNNLNKWRCWLVSSSSGNKRGIDATASRMNLEESKVLMNIESMEYNSAHYL